MSLKSLLQATGPLLIVAAGAAAFALLTSLRARPDSDPPETKPPPVRTIVLPAARQEFVIEVPGQVVPRREVTLAAEVPGRVVTRPDNIRAGRHVARDTLLVQLDPGDYELAIKTAQLEVRAVDLEIDRLNTETTGIVALVGLGTEDLKLAGLELERIELLLKQKTATTSDRDRAKRSELAARNQLQTLKNQHDLLPIRRRQLLSKRDRLVTELHQARRNLERTRIRAPFDGLLTLATAEVGDFVQAGDVMLKIEETAAVEIECRLRTDDLHWLRDSVASRDTKPDAEPDSTSRYEVPEVSATVTYRESGRVHRFAGRLTRFTGKGIDPRTRTIPCRVIVPRLQDTPQAGEPTVLMRGMYVTVSLKASPETPLIAIPAEAVRPNRQAWSVVDNKLVIHPLDVARVLSDSVLVPAASTELGPGDRVVISPLKIAYNGMPVRERAAEKSSRESGPREGSP